MLLREHWLSAQGAALGWEPASNAALTPNSGDGGLGPGAHGPSALLPAAAPRFVHRQGSQGGCGQEDGEKADKTTSKVLSHPATYS